MAAKRWGFGFGTIFSLIVAYFIYLYSSDKGWALLAFVSKWYLIIVGGMIALSFAILLIMLLIPILLFLSALLRMRKFGKKHKSKKNGYIDAEYKIKE